MSHLPTLITDLALILASAGLMTLIFKRLNGAVLAHGGCLRQIMDELLERNRAAVLGKVVGLERLADERRERQIARVARHVDGLVGHALEAHELDHDRNARNAHGRDVAQARDLDLVAPHGSAVFGHDHDHRLAAGAFKLAQEGADVVEHLLSTRLEGLGAAAAGQAADIRRLPEVYGR